MKKLVLQILIFTSIFFATWFMLSHINWVNIFNVKQLTKNTEEKIGDLFWDIINNSETEIQNKTIKLTIDSLLSHICTSNDIDKSLIKLHIIENADINAFALPNKHLIIFTGLIVASENEAELSGVICHELAHLELNHIMKKLINEVGLSVLISMTTTNNNSGIIKESVKFLSSTAFERELEREADLKAVDYLIKSNFDPEQFANFLYRMTDAKSGFEEQLSWIQTHPEPKERAEYIIDYNNNNTVTIKTVLSNSAWEKLQSDLRNN